MKEEELASTQNDLPATTTPTASTKSDTHSDFKIFYADFKKAINSGNKDAVVSMTNIPFKDQYREELKMVQGIGRPRTSKSIDGFKSNYSKIFTSKIVNLINSNSYIGYEKREQLGNYSDDFKKEQYLLLYETNEGLLFDKVNGTYKLLSIPHYDMTFDGD